MFSVFIIFVGINSRIGNQRFSISRQVKSTGIDVGMKIMNGSSAGGHQADLVSLLYQIMNQKQLDMWIIFGYDIREYYKQIETLEEFKAWMLDLSEILLENVRQKRQTVDIDMQEKLTQIIDENLENDISLDFLCDQFDMRLDVLSRQFKQVMGKGYTEYIKEKKMARVLELLAEDCSVKEIAERLGYRSPQYFIKLFKEIYGLTPYQYKKQKLGKEA